MHRPCLVCICTWQGSLPVPALVLLLQVLQNEVVQVFQEAPLAQAGGHSGATADVEVAGVQDFGQVVLLPTLGVCAGRPRHVGLWGGRGSEVVGLEATGSSGKGRG